MKRRWANFRQLVLDLWPGVSGTIDPVGSAALADRSCRQSVEIVANPRLQCGWRARRMQAGGVRVEVPEALLMAPPEIRASLEVWGRTVWQRDSASRASRREAAARIGSWFRASVSSSSRRVPADAPDGKHRNLRILFDALNAEFFGGRLRARLRWTPRRGKSSHATWFSNGKEEVTAVLTISRRFDRPDVPLAALEGVMYHEMLHLALPPKQGAGGRRIVHHREFRETERVFRSHDAWKSWELSEASRIRTKRHLRQERGS